MNSKIPWSLPEGVDEILPAKALQVENFRRELLPEKTCTSYEENSNRTEQDVEERIGGSSDCISVTQGGYHSPLLILGLSCDHLDMHSNDHSNKT